MVLYHPRACHSSGGWSPASHNRDLGSFPCKSICGGQSGRVFPPVLPVSPVKNVSMLHICISFNYHQFYKILATDSAVKQNISHCLSLDLCYYFVLELYKLWATWYLANDITHTVLHAFYVQGVNNSVGED